VVFVSAAECFVARLARAGLPRDAGDLYAIGRIVLFAPRGSPLRVDADLKGLAELVTRGPVRFAIANPEHAPYGRAAEAVLRVHRLWEPLRPSLVLGENVSQAAQFATTGNAVGGIIAYSLALAPPLENLGTFVLLRESEHPPLRQRMVRLKRAGPLTDRFYDYLKSAPAKAIFSKYGFRI
jgi:molybdate transport system substrate-binding protein